jgi:hypothetical protein
MRNISMESNTVLIKQPFYSGANLKLLNLFQNKIDSNGKEIKSFIGIIFISKSKDPEIILN